MSEIGSRWKFVNGLGKVFVYLGTDPDNDGMHRMVFEDALVRDGDQVSGGVYDHKPPHEQPDTWRRA